MARKPRSDSVLDSLPPERREQLVRWLVDENLKYPEAVTRVWERFGVKTSVSALQKFYARRCFTLRAEQANEAIQEIGEGSRKTVDMVGDISDAIREQSMASTAIAQQVEKIAQMSEENSAAANATSASADELAGLSEAMQRVVAQYRI